MSGWAAAVTAALGLAQTYIEGRKAAKTNLELQRLFSHRKAYQTPKEIFDIANLTTQNAAQGYSDETTAYLTGQAGAGASSALGVAERLGADPNQLGGILDKYYQDIFSIGAGNEMEKMKKFDSLTSALNLLGQHRDAEWQSADNLLKDQMQAAAQRFGAASQGVNSGLNLAVTGLANLAGTNMYGSNKTTTEPKTVVEINNSSGEYSEGGGGMTPSEILARRNRPI